MWLTDNSPSTSYLVTLPADSGRSQTRLHLAGTSQIPDNSTVFLSVSMDGQQVFNNKLAPGDTEIETYIDVPEQIAADGQVRVQIRADGTRHDETCTPDHSAGLQIHLDPDSLVEAALDQPIHTVRDAVVSWDRNVTIALIDQASNGSLLPRKWVSRSPGQATRSPSRRTCPNRMDAAPSWSVRTAH